MTDDLDAVFKALADPTRRTLLDRLRERNGQTLGELCDQLGMARQSATQHLGVLEAASLVTAVRRGRQKLHYLNPVPIYSIQQRWIANFELPRLRALSALKRRAEEEQMASIPAYVYVTYIESTPERVWHALTDADLTAGYWGHSNVSDWQPGSPWQHVRADGSGVADVTGTVLEADPPRRLVLTFRIGAGDVRHHPARRHRPAHRDSYGAREPGRVRSGLGRLAGRAVEPQVPAGDRARAPAATLGNARRAARRADGAQLLADCAGPA